ncbi:MAG: ABC transporter permease [Phycisphaerales bacterium]|jgi:putative ABC transport system permease protein|nr:ABC transporter permease [Phycisphaerales bacterium]
MIIIRLLLQTVVLAFTQLWSNKFRALLTMLGIMIGVGAVIATVAATQGLKNYVLKEFDTFGARKVWMDGTIPPRMRGRVSWTQYDLRLSEIQFIKDNATTIDAITPMHFVGATVRNDEQNRQNVTATGIWPDWHEIEKRTVIKGRPLIKSDIDEIRSVCLVNDKAIAELNLDVDPTNDYIFVNDRRFLIVGVLETKAVAQGFPGGGEARTELFIPYSTAIAMQPRDTANFALAQLKDVSVADEAKAEIGSILRRLRKLGGEDENTFQVETVQSIIDQINRLGTGLTIAAAGLMCISLLVGGIGIMNIMLVSVSERTREIGLRKAVGARPMIILMQFLVEAVVLCLIGGLIGMAAGIGLVRAVGAIPNSPLIDAQVPWWAIAIGIGFSAMVGIVFGMFPAIKAARLDPIVALRHE